MERIDFAWVSVIGFSILPPTVLVSLRRFPSAPRESKDDGDPGKDHGRNERFDWEMTRKIELLSRR